MKYVSPIIIFAVFLLCIQVASSAVTIQFGEDGRGYSWSRTTLTITGASEEYILSSDIYGRIVVHVDARDVALDGNGVSIAGIRGQPTLDLRNIRIDGGIFYTFVMDNGHEYEAFSGISECRNIKDSSIVVDGTGGYVYGIGKLYGNLDDTTSITVTSDEVPWGINSVYGEVSGGQITTTGEGAGGIARVYGEISGGQITVTGTLDWATGVSVIEESGKVSGGVFIVTCDCAAKPTGRGNADGITYVRDSGEVSGGEFTITSSGNAEGVGSVYDSGKVSGGVFAVTSSENAKGVGGVWDSGIVSGGEFTVTATGSSASASGVSSVRDSGIVSGGVFAVTSSGNASGVDHVGNFGTVSGGEFTITSSGQAGMVSHVSDSGKVSGGGFIVNGRRLI